MSKKKKDDVPPPTPAPPADRHVSPRVVFYLPDELLAALDRVAGKNDRTRTAEILRALKSHLTREGEWPPPPAEGGGK